MYSFITGQQTNNIGLQKKQGPKELNNTIDGIFKPGEFNVPNLNPFELQKKELTDKINEFRTMHKLVEARMNWINEKERMGELFKIPNYEGLLTEYEKSVTNTNLIKNDIINRFGQYVTTEEIIGGLNLC
jgi:hypothetical protein